MWFKGWPAWRFGNYHSWRWIFWWTCSGNSQTTCCIYICHWWFDSSPYVFQINSTLSLSNELYGILLLKRSPIIPLIFVVPVCWCPYLLALFFYRTWCSGIWASARPLHGYHETKYWRLWRTTSQIGIK